MREVVQIMDSTGQVKHTDVGDILTLLRVKTHL